MPKEKDLRKTESTFRFVIDHLTETDMIIMVWYFHHHQQQQQKQQVRHHHVHCSSDFRNLLLVVRGQKKSQLRATKFREHCLVLSPKIIFNCPDKFGIKQKKSQTDISYNKNVHVVDFQALVVVNVL
jgi:exopolysaccharide biosynthesis predicted pyruvyltransferase EpsI